MGNEVTPWGFPVKWVTGALVPDLQGGGSLPSHPGKKHCNAGNSSKQEYTRGTLGIVPYGMLGVVPYDTWGVVLVGWMAIANISHAFVATWGIATDTCTQDCP